MNQVRNIEESQVDKKDHGDHIPCLIPCIVFKLSNIIALVGVFQQIVSSAVALLLSDIAPLLVIAFTVFTVFFLAWMTVVI